MSPAGLLTKQKPANIITELEVLIPGLPPSLNNMYPTSRQGRRYVSKEGKAFKKLAKAIVAIAIRGNQLAPDEWYHVRIDFYTQLFYKNGKPKKWDVTNHQKAVEDSLAEAVGVDDSRFLVVWGRKLPITYQQEKMTHVRIEPVKLPFCDDGGAR